MIATGWLSRLTDWLREAFQSLFDAFKEMLEDLFLAWLKNVLSLYLWVLDTLPMPDFLSSYSLCSLLSSAGPTVGWALNTFRIGEALGLLATGYTFRMLRKIATLFQW